MMAPMVTKPSQQAAMDFVSKASFLWHQRFQLAPGVYTPGANDVEFLLAQAAIPDISGATVLDIGTTNGGLAFEMERRGAAHVVAVDIYDGNWFGFDAIKTFLKSKVEYHCASVYELPRVFASPFDIVAFWGVLYHLRHPLLALDAIRTVTRGSVMIETAVFDHAAREVETPTLYFHRYDDLNKDGSNWFEPTVKALTDMCESSGLRPVAVKSWPPDKPARSMVTAVPTSGDPEYLGMSYEKPLDTTIAAGYLLPGQEPAA
jgi:tRNA (mo5U34)-methyltransferase